MRTLILWRLMLPLCLAWASPVRAEDGLLRVAVSLPPTQALARLETLVAARGLQVFARIDHSAGAATAGLSLRPTLLLIFGHPKGGTPLMQCAQTVGIDLPLKALVWQDDSGRTWVALNDPEHLARRHGAADCPALQGLRKLTAGLMTDLAASP